ncbi:MAG TPA: PDZ domain-containing protein [Pyrinomonadaceae bacterium]|nr:PDZ domain-containing protein [Pyrinomonadaceae bacterium]
MTFKSVFYLSVSLLFTAGIALAQQPATPATPAEPAEPFQSFSFSFDGDGFLGVYTEDITKDNLSQYGLREARGVGVTEVAKDSPAEKAGLRKGDVITRFDGEVVSSARKLSRLVSEVAPDHKVTLGISRGGSDQEVAVTVGKRKNEFTSMRKMTIPHFPEEFGKWEMPEGTNVFMLGNSRRIGVSTSSLTKQLADFFGVVDGQGVLITSVTENSPAAKAGLKAGDVITAVDGEKIDGAGDLSRAINKQKDGEITLTVVRDKNQRTFKVSPEKSGNELLKTGRTARNKELRNQIRQSIRDGIRDGNVVIPAIALPTIPAINVTMPRIELPVIPEIRIGVPRVRVIKDGVRQPI